MASKLSYNVDDLLVEAKEMHDVADKLRDAKTTLKSNLDTLKDEWVSTASDRFFASVDSDWESAVSRYITLLGDLESELRAAATDYEGLEDEYNKISLG